MEIGNLSLFSVFKKRMAWLGQRQEVLAQNIANSDTPEYKARDLKAFKFEDLVRRENAGLSMNSTEKNHLGGRRMRVRDFAEAEDRKPYETNPNGNSVVLEEQMAKMSENSISHNLVSELYKKHMGMIRMALGRR